MKFIPAGQQEFDTFEYPKRIGEFCSEDKVVPLCTDDQLDCREKSLSFYSLRGISETNYFSPKATDVIQAQSCDHFLCNCVFARYLLLYAEALDLLA